VETFSYFILYHQILNIYAIKYFNFKLYFGRAKRGDGTVKDGRKTERSSAPYAEAYSPRFCEYMKKNNTILIFIGQFTGRPVDAFDSAYVLPAMYIKRISLEKATELKIQ